MSNEEEGPLGGKAGAAKMDVSMDTLIQVYMNGMMCGGTTMLNHMRPDMGEQKAMEFMQTLCDAFWDDPSGREGILREVCETLVGVDTGPSGTVIPVTGVEDPRINS